MNEEIRKVAATVIAKARDDHPAAIARGPAAFDYAVAGGDQLAELALKNACYDVANPGWLTGPTGHSAEHAVRAASLWDAIAAELDAYRQRCRGREYTGWSNASAEPIRYAR